ncbi:dipeptidyl peptidase 4-like isoform X1 [Centruroides sculpturatus]|uniref:dipeptidyl peptidase 4-like isoform X1 n=2 Tax=Centruroides sculpturatus TaxID=218467 RepID=UPI000C6E3F35|nr:dipeptidyl peptidase 4-like isoform X1 [Centruroides sculpturatus]
MHGRKYVLCFSMGANKYEKVSVNEEENSLQFEKEVAVAAVDRPNWRGIGISLLVIVAVCSLIALAILLLTPRNTGLGITGERFSLADIIKDDFVPRSFNGTWVPGDRLIFRNGDGHLVVYSPKTRKYRILVHNSTFEDNKIEKYSVSADMQYVLLIHDIIKIFRHSFIAKYKIYNVTNRQIIPLIHADNPETFLRYAGWGPKGNQLVYVYANNIYYLTSVFDTAQAIIGTGLEGDIFHGVPDWLYEEEILGSNSAIWWSPDGSSICFASFNDSKVGTLYYNWYGDYGDPSNIYPQLQRLHYPKAGRENPTVSLWVADLRNTNKIIPRDVKPPREVQDQLVHVWDHYFTTVTWIDSQSLAVVWMTRSQNYSLFTLCTGTLWYCSVVSEQKAIGGRGWVDLYDAPILTRTGGKWYLKLPIAEGNFGYFRHVAVVHNVTRRIDFLTQGKYDITKLLAYHDISRSVYYISTKEGRPGERHLYSVLDQRFQPSRITKCWTCGNDKCLYNNAIISPSTDYYVLECLGPGIPRIEIRTVQNNVLVDVLDVNADLQERMGQRAFPKIRTFKVPTKGGYKAQVRLFLPPGLEDDEALLYPLVVHVYGGPGSQLVSEKFYVHWGTYLASRKNYIYAWIDGRGSGFQGDKMEHELFRRFGTVEVEDQIEITRYLRDNLPFINPSHIAIWGWSYGGYVAATALADENTVFKCAISVAPVTSWQYYDSAYTERYMGTPQPLDNYLGYERSDLIKKASKLKGKKFLLIHGTADDNVHFQHTAMFIKALTEAGVIFQTQIYPDENHFLTNVKNHLYQTMEDFLNECFFIEMKEEIEATRVKKDVKGR